jgi:hypothetical protein
MPGWPVIHCATVITALVATYTPPLSNLTFFNQRYETDSKLLHLTKPLVDFQIGNDPDKLPVGIAIKNAGSVPADIRSIIFYVGQKPVDDAEEAAHEYGKLSLGELDYEAFDPDDKLAVGEIAWLIQYRKPKNGVINQKNLAQFANFVDQNLGIEINFCSVMQVDLCWTKCSTKGRCH